MLNLGDMGRKDNGFMVRFALHLSRDTREYMVKKEAAMAEKLITEQYCSHNCVATANHSAIPAKHY